MEIISDIPYAEAADIALKNRLYVSGWCLSERLKKIRNNKYPDAKVILAKEEGQYVGVVVQAGIGITRWNTAAFVKKSYRRKGVASKMLQHVDKKRAVAVCGIDGCERMWDKNNISWHY